MTVFYVDIEAGYDAVRDTILPARNAVLVGAPVPLVDATQVKFGAFALNLVAASSSAALRIPYEPNGEFHLGADLFTVEAWVRFTTHSATATEVIAGNYSGATNLGWLFSMGSTGSLAFGYSTTGADGVSVGAAYTPALNTYIHLAADRDAGNTLRVYADGVIIASGAAAATFFASTRDLFVGNDGNLTRKLPGHIGALRITKGVARYAGAFTPPTAAFPVSVAAGDASFASVTLLLNFAESCDGLSFANRWRTFTNGPTAARIAAGDTIRLIASPDPTLVGDALWTQYSKNVVLAAAVTANISDCETVWTGAANVTQTADTTDFKEGTRSARSVVAAAFTTGKVAHFAIGPLNLAAYQQVSFWHRNTLVTAAGVLSLRLCSDTAGDVTVHTLPIPLEPTGGRWRPVTVDLGANLSAAIASVALYADLDPGAATLNLDNIIACKASSALDALSLHSLIGRAHNQSWVALSVYAADTVRRPTQPSRNGYSYRVSAGGGGAAGASEPVWPPEIGLSVTDGALTWICHELEDTWYPIQSINGTLVKIDNSSQTLGNAGRGQSGSTETVATHRRQPIRPAMVAAPTTGLVVPLKTGTPTALITYSGGWDRAAMATQTAETWFDGQNGVGYCAGTYSAGGSFYLFENLSAVRMSYGSYLYGSHFVTYKNCHFIGMSTGMISGIASMQISLRGVNLNNASNYGLADGGDTQHDTVRALSANNSGVNGIYLSGSTYTSEKIQFDGLSIRNSGDFAIRCVYGLKATVKNLVTGNNALGVVALAGGSGFTFVNCLLPEAVLANNTNAFYQQYVYSQKHNQIAGNHLVSADGGTITSATDQRRTASGIAWKFRPTSTNRHVLYPLQLSVAKIACAAGQPVSIKVWSRRDNANIKGQLYLPGGQLVGVPGDLSVPCEPIVNTWAESAPLSFTPTEPVVVEVFFRCWDGIGIVNSLWIDDLSVSQV